MVFTSLTFLVLYFPLVVLLHTCCRRTEIRNLVLFVASLVFYVWGEPRYIFVLFFSIVFNYFAAIILDRIENKRIRTIFFYLSVLINLLLLGYFKYANFIIFNLNRVLGLAIPYAEITLPIGISFYTFQILSYLIDTYRRKIAIQHNIITLATYIILFPQLVAGPIVRYSTIENELKQRTVNTQGLYDGCKLFVVGLSKKMLIANQMAFVADTIFAVEQGKLTTLLIWVAAVAYMMQIYFDFSGYSDMAIGMGKMLGFNFDINFNYPYMATSITDFWRRWHISLSTWFRDYVYIPLGGNRVSKLRWIFNILVVWGLTGFWHGAGWNFILWGLYYAVLLLIEKLIFNKKPFRIPVLSRFITLFLVLIGWVIFRTEGLSQLVFIVQKMFLFDGNFQLVEMLSEFPELYFSYFLFIPAVLFSIEFKYNKIPNLVQEILLMVLYGLCLIAVISSTYNPFIYFRF